MNVGRKNKQQLEPYDEETYGTPECPEEKIPWESEPSSEIHSKLKRVNGRQLCARELD